MPQNRVGFQQEILLKYVSSGHELGTRGALNKRSLTKFAFHKTLTTWFSGN